jgi:hypothetical protein
LSRSALRPILLALALLAPRLRAEPRADPPLPKAAPEGATVAETLRRARSYFEYGDNPNASLILDRLVSVGRFESPEQRAEAYRLLGLADFFQGKRAEAYQAFRELVFIDPDTELDPFYYPPAAVAFFEEVKKNAEKELAPVRAQRRLEEEARRRAAVEEAQRRLIREREEEQRRLAAIAPTIERRVIQHDFWVNLIPFGVGQFQNGDRTLGAFFATSELLAAATSASSALLIEGLRNQGGTFSGTDYQRAQKLDAAKWISAGVFYGLWLIGAVQASVAWQPETQLPDRLITRTPLPPPVLPPSLGPLQPPAGTPQPQQPAPQESPAPAEPQPASPPPNPTSGPHPEQPPLAPLQ